LFTASRLTKARFMTDQKYPQVFRTDPENDSLNKYIEYVYNKK